MEEERLSVLVHEINLQRQEIKDHIKIFYDSKNILRLTLIDLDREQQKLNDTLTGIKYFPS